MLTIWIIHRQTHQRAALARIAGTADSTVLGGPEDKLFESASAPDLVILGLSGDFEVELEFAHRVGARLRDTAWLVLAPKGDLDEARRLFDTLPAAFLQFPPSPAALRGQIHSALRRRGAAPLSRRRSRDVLSHRFARWFADLDLPELMRALDPKRAAVPLLVVGERGTGRGLVAHYAHAYGGAPDDRFIHVPCRYLRTREELLEQLSDARKGADAACFTVWLEDIDHLPPPLQRHLREWIEYGVPEGAVRAAALRWIATAADPDEALDEESGGQLDPDLAAALSGLRIHIPPLRERSSCIEAFATQAASDWNAARGEEPRSFSPETLELLREYPWPGNLQELESVLGRTLSVGGREPILPAHLHFEGSETPPAYESYAEAHLSEAELPEAELVPEVEEPPDALIIEEPEAVPSIAAAIPVDPPPVPSIDATPPTPSPREAAAARADAPDWPRIVRSLAHEIRNPLVSIRTFSELLPERFDDDEFRARFAELVGDDVRRIEDLVTRLQTLTEEPEPRTEQVDTATLLDDLLEERREEIEARRLLVLKELDRENPLAVVDAVALRGALSGVLGKALSLLPDQGDIYVASRHHGAGRRGAPMLRVLLRYSHRPPRSALGDAQTVVAENLLLDEQSLEMIVAEKVVTTHGGSLTLDTSDGQETVLIIDLPAPAQQTIGSSHTSAGM